MKIFCAVVAALMALGAPVSANAGVYADDLSRCVVSSTTDGDRLELVIWTFGALSAHPAVRPMSTVTEAQRDASSGKAAALFQRLLVRDCREEAVAALKYEGPSAFEGAFGLLGEVAFGSISKQPEVQAQFAKLGTMVDEAQFVELYAEAGIVQPAATPKP